MLWRVFIKRRGVVTLIVDIGSSNTWVGADASFPYVPTDTSRSTDTIMVRRTTLKLLQVLTCRQQFIEYGSGVFIGWLLE